MRFILLFLLAIPVMAAPPTDPSLPVVLRVGAGSSTGLYSQALKDLCPHFNNLSFHESKSDGPLQNFDLLLKGKVDIAFVPSDVMVVSSEHANLDEFKTVVALFPENIQFIAISHLPGVADPNDHGSVEDLKGLKVGAASNSILTAKLINTALTQAGGGYAVVEYPTTAAAMAALNKGAVDAIEVTGQDPLLTKLTADYRLLSISGKLLPLLSDTYHPVTEEIPNLHQGAVETVAADCLVVAHASPDPNQWRGLELFRDLTTLYLDDVQRVSPIKAQWAEVSQANHGTWGWMSFPNDKVVIETTWPGASESR